MAMFIISGDVLGTPGHKISATFCSADAKSMKKADLNASMKKAFKKGLAKLERDAAKSYKKPMKVKAYGLQCVG